jgi:AcrR family transcriptional regulator
MDSIKKRKNGIETSNRILEISADFFARKGYDNVSLRKIADAVGIKESSLYNHFKSKAAIKEALFTFFAQMTFESRPSESELDKMLLIMQPEEVFKSIVFHVGNTISATMQNIAIIIHNEKYRDTRAFEMYRKYLIEEPVEYYKRLIEKMVTRKMIKPVDAQIFAEQYIYVSTALTQEYFMAKNGFLDEHTVVRSMLKTLGFFIDLMR